MKLPRFFLSVSTTFLPLFHDQRQTWFAQLWDVQVQILQDSGRIQVPELKVDSVGVSSATELSTMHSAGVYFNNTNYYNNT